MGKNPSGCVCGLSSYYFIISHDQYFIILLNPNSSQDHYILAILSSFLLILLLSLLRFAWFLVCGEQECLLQVCVGLLAWFVDGKEHSAIKFWFSSKSGVILPIFEEVFGKRCFSG